MSDSKRKIIEACAYGKKWMAGGYEMNLDEITLASGAHSSPEDGMCAMEAVAYIAGEPFSDHPKCACPVLSAFMRSWNDSLDDDDRNRLLKPLVPLLVGTRATADVEERRSWLATDWLIRVCTPAFLELTTSLRPHAQALAGLPPVLSRESAAAAAQGDIKAARAAAGDAARAATWAAARAAAWAAAGDAARAATWDAAGDAARAATWDAFRPTVVTLQESAVELVKRMIAEGQRPKTVPVWQCTLEASWYRGRCACGWEGPAFSDRDKAIAAWNQRVGEMPADMAQRLIKENDQLLEQTRVRRYPDEEPDACEYVLYWDGYGWEAWCVELDGDNSPYYWLPMPPDPDAATDTGCGDLQRDCGDGAKE